VTLERAKARKEARCRPAEHNTNLFTDASFLAVPAINFFGLPGYQQETPPQMPSRFFEDGRQQFWMRKFAKRRNGSPSAGDRSRDAAPPSNPWFMLCGCPTYKAWVASGERNMDHSPKMDGREYEWEPENGPDALIEARMVKEDLAGAPSTAARETAAANAKSSARALQQHRSKVSLLHSAQVEVRNYIAHFVSMQWK